VLRNREKVHANNYEQLKKKASRQVRTRLSSFSTNKRGIEIFFDPFEKKAKEKVCVLFGTTTRPPWHFTSLPPNSEPLLPVAYSVRDVVVTYQACCGVVCPRAGRGRCGFTERKSERHSCTSTLAFTARGRALLLQQVNFAIDSLARLPALLSRRFVPVSRG
jgi:hypothetical protein